MGDEDNEPIAKPELDELRAVNLTDFGEARAWALLLGCSVEQLQDAVQLVGADLERLRRHLKSL